MEISLSEAANTLGFLSTACLRRACQRGEIKGARKVGKTWLVRPTAAGAWAATKRKQGQARGVSRRAKVTTS